MVGGCLSVCWAWVAEKRERDKYIYKREDEEERRRRKVCVCGAERETERARVYVCVCCQRKSIGGGTTYMRTHRSNRGRLHYRRARKLIRSPISLPACAAIAACSLSATDVSCLNRILMRRLYNKCTRASGQHTNGRFASPTTMFENFSQTLRYHFREKKKKNVGRACYF
jgi:hypothetical protein